MDKQKLNKNNPEITGIILAAGYSKRMNAFKPLLQFKGKSFIRNIIEKTLPVCKQVLIVTGFKKDAILAELKKYNLISRVKVVFNKNYSDGMFSSLQTALRSTDNFKWALYHFVDQPFLPDEFYSLFVKEIENGFNWIQPVFNSIKGHPILFDEKVAKIILKSNNYSNLRDIVQNNNIKKKYWYCNYEGTTIDTDYPEDLHPYRINK